MKAISAIVLLLWVVCYGRCLTDQYGGTENSERAWCEHQCCESEQPVAPPPAPVTSCGICDFLRSGIVLPGDGNHLDEARFSLESGIEPIWHGEGAVVPVDRDRHVTVSSTAPPSYGRLCEWVARTAAPVRGPTA